MFKLVAIWGTVAALGTLVYALPTTEPNPNECSAGRVVTAAQWGVEALLRDVQTATFSNMKTKEGIVTGTVRAQNVFGAYVVHSFVASVDCVNNKAVVKGVVIQ